MPKAVLPRPIEVSPDEVAAVDAVALLDVGGGATMPPIIVAPMGGRLFAIAFVAGIGGTAGADIAAGGGATGAAARGATGAGAGITRVPLKALCGRDGGEAGGDLATGVNSLPQALHRVASSDSRWPQSGHVAIPNGPLEVSPGATAAQTRAWVDAIAQRS